MKKKLNNDELVTRIKSELFKDSLENLSLFLNEIEKLINLPEGVISEEDRQYKLKMLECHIASMSSMIKDLNNEKKYKNILLS